MDNEFFEYLQSGKYFELYRSNFNEVLRTLYTVIKAAVRDKVTTISLDIHGIVEYKNTKIVSNFSFDELGMEASEQQRLAQAHFRALRRIFASDSMVQKHLQLVTDTPEEMVCQFITDN